MFVIEMLPAGHGDALLVSWGDPGAPRRMLIDAGPFHSWPEIRTRLKAHGNVAYDQFVITHVDEDHIGGAIALLDDVDLRHRVRSVWFNGFIHCDAPRLEREGGPMPNVLGPIQGEQLTHRIHGHDLAWNQEFDWGPTGNRFQLSVGGPVMVADEGAGRDGGADSDAALPVVDLAGGARLVLLGPTGPKLEKMAAKWKEVVTRAGLVPGMGDPDHTDAPGPFRRDVEVIDRPLTRADLEAMADGPGYDSSEANGSSIAFVLEFEGRRLLLSGDAHGSTLRDGLDRYGAMVGEERPRIDLVKLPHHGSGANVTKSLARDLNADRFLISTNADKFGHPNDSAIARLILAADDAGRADVTFYCNYRSDRTDYWAARGPGVGANFSVPDDDSPGLQVSV